MLFSQNKREKALNKELLLVTRQEEKMKKAALFWKEAIIKKPFWRITASGTIPFKSRGGAKICGKCTKAPRN